MSRIKAILMVVSMVAVVVVISAPVMAQDFGQEFSERRITSGPAAPKAAISNTGDNVNLCAPVQQVANTGNVANEQGVTQIGGPGTTTTTQLALPFGFFVGSDGLVHDNDGFIVGTVDDFLVPVVDGFFGEPASGDIDLTGSEINIEPTETATCDQTINQAAAA
jgi:hypothetical protein